MSAGAGGFHGFYNKEYILNLASVFVDYLKKKGVSVSWDISEESLGHSGLKGSESLICDTVCIVGSRKFPVLFMEDRMYTLYVFVGGVEVLSIAKDESFSSERMWKIFNALGVSK
ncbi:MAG: hypothetical protein LBH20_02625 [Treponema sp.]|nr:hypothetical protein [Treponema sp.]